VRLVKSIVWLFVWMIALLVVEGIALGSRFGADLFVVLALLASAYVLGSRHSLRQRKDH
jgi:hypothetical protein